MRSVESTKHILTTLKLVPIVEAVTLTFVSQQIRDGQFQPTEQNDSAAQGMLAELLKWAKALKTLRD